jgi:hypothetical protein
MVGKPDAALVARMVQTAEFAAQRLYDAALAAYEPFGSALQTIEVDRLSKIWIRGG